MCPEAARFTVPTIRSRIFDRMRISGDQGATFGAFAVLEV